MTDNSHFETMNITRLKRQTTRQLTTFNLEKRSKTLYIPRGEKVTIGEVSGRGHIANMWMTFPGWFWQHWNTSNPVSQTILKTLILRIWFDDAEEPAVQAPAGDFFGCGLCEAANFTSRYFGLSSGGFFCKYPMPFHKGFRIEVENMDEHVHTDVFMNVLYQVDEELPENTAWFHAQFRTDSNPGPEPVEIAGFEGHGHFAGCTLAMQGMERNYLSFLEAPEYIYIDDDWETPRIVGTGLEDYFMGGWYFREGIFDGDMHGLPSKDTLNASVAMYRIHDEDAIHFSRRFRMAFVNPWDPDRLKPFVWSSCAFAYLDTPEGTGGVIPPREKLLCWPRIRNTDHQSIP